MNLSDGIHKFNSIYKNAAEISKSLVTVDGHFQKNISIKDVKNEPNEEYYKWQFIYGLIQSGMYSPDYIGTEVYFPKGNIHSHPIKIDGVIFSDIAWLDYYRKYREKKDQDALAKIRELAVGVIEFKRKEKKIEEVFSSQVRASIKEPDAPFVLGVYYDEGRQYLFRRSGDVIARLDNSKNFPTSQRILERFQLEITDPYYMMPSHDDLIRLNADQEPLEWGSIKVEDLDVVYTVTDQRIKDALNHILRSLDSVSMVNEQGYLVLIQLLAIKIYDEKQSDLHGSNLRFFVQPSEQVKQSLAEPGVQQFISRLKELYGEAKVYYQSLLADQEIDWSNIRHVRIAASITEQLQAFTFTRSKQSDLYQLVFYNFASAFKKDAHGQFLTPLPIIQFLVDIVNPRRSETVLDPCCGTADFLSVGYVNAESKLDDNNLYGLDNDHQMVLLSQLNMLLNGDGNAHIEYVPDKGAITNKFSTNKSTVSLHPDYHKGGNWDNWVDGTELMEFDVVLTNPPFGKGRNLNLGNDSDRSAAEYYSLYEDHIEKNPKDGLDLGVVFLENTVRSLKTGGRFGIIVSNSIASNKTWQFAREWLIKNVRVVALFDLPSNVFAETGANTTLIVGYKPDNAELNELVDNNYSVFIKDISKVGYEKKTSNRNVIFEKKYKLNEETFETIIDSNGESVLDEEFTDTISEFREWCLFQELELKRKFLD